MNDPSPARSMAISEWLTLIALSILWGGSFFFVAVAVKELPTLTIVTTRVVLAAVALLALMRALGQRLPSTRGVWLMFVAMALLNNVLPFLLIVWGQHYIASGTASILNATAPLFAVLVAHVFTQDDKLTRARAAGVVLGFIGVVVIVGFTALQSIGTDVLAQLAIVVAAISYAFAAVLGRRFRTLGIAPLATATGQVIASSGMLIPLQLVIDQPWTMAPPSATAVAVVVALALFSTALAYVLYFRLLATAGATNLLLVTFLIPVTALLLGTLVLGEPLQMRQVAGMAIIALGLAAVDGRLLKRWRT
jgi:drug/metabolite transporter (DMT)-like permease